LNLVKDSVSILGRCCAGFRKFHWKFTRKRWHETSYQNNKDTYNFDDFNIRSSFDEDRVRTINVNSPDIIEGEIVGKFQFAELGI
jgi:hypothetical protein